MKKYPFGQFSLGANAVTNYCKYLFDETVWVGIHLSLVSSIGLS